MTKSKALRLLVEAMRARACDYEPCRKALGPEPRIHFRHKQYHPRCFALTGQRPSVDGAAMVGQLIRNSRAGLSPLRGNPPASRRHSLEA